MRFGRYEILRELGRGSMGVVFEAYDPQIDRTLALKVLRPDCCAGKESVQSFLKEARTIGKLTHPNIVTVYDAGADHSTIFIAMELLEGQPLSQVCRARRLGVEEILRLGIQIAETLDFAHKKGVIHRDIKPSNIVALTDGHIKITDFGIAHIEDPTATLQTFEGELVGTPAYMSPEQIQCKPVDGRSDIFAVGVLLYELSTGTKPFGGKGKTLATLFREITQISPREPVAVNELLDSRLSDVIMRCLLKDPNDRFESGHALAEALRGCQTADPKSHPPPLPHVPQVDYQVFRLPLSILFLVCAVAGFALSFRKELVKTVGGALWAAAPLSATLNVHTNPGGASIAIDGAPKGNSPLKLTLPAGEHRVTAKLDGYVPWGDQITLGRAKDNPLAVRLQPLPRNASPKATATPAPAAVRSENLPEDSRFQGTGTAVSKPVASPPRKEPVLKVVSSPQGAAIYVDGKQAGTAPSELPVSPGEHLLTLKYADHEPWERRIRVEEGCQYPFNAELNPVLGDPVLRLESDPPKALVLVDGIEKGRAPLKVKLAPGKHRVRFKLKRHKDWETQVALAKAEEVPIKARLTPVAPPKRTTSTASAVRPNRSSNLSAAGVINEVSPQNVWRRIRSWF